jgi:hypothetical protein
MTGFLRRHGTLLLPAFVYLYLFPYQPILRSPNELSRLRQTRALVDHGTLELTAALYEHGPVGDLACVAVARGPDGRVQERRPCPQTRLAADGARFCEQRFFPSKAPLLSFAAAPVYAALRLVAGDVPELPLMFFARLCCVLLPALYLLVLLRRFLAAEVGPALAGPLTLAYALGTLAFSYAEQLVSHQLAAVLLFGCYYLLWRLRRGEWPRRGYVLVGLLAGASLAAEYTSALALVPLAAYGALTAPGGWRGRLGALLRAGLGALPVLLALGAYHQAAFGHPLATGYAFLNDRGFQAFHQGGLLGIGLPDRRAFVQSFLSPQRGLFTLSPMLVLALPRLLDPRHLRRRSPELRLGLGLLLVYTYFTSSFAYDSWGWSTGPRHLTPLMPFLMLPLGLFLRSLGEPAVGGRGPGSAWWQVVLGGVAAGLSVLSVATTGVMTLLNYISPNFTNALHQIALPLAVRGYLPHSWLSLFGVPNPYAALPGVLALLAAALACGGLLLRGRARWLPALGVALLTVGLVGGMQTAVHTAPARVEREAQAALYMAEIYVPKPFQAPPTLWTPDTAFPASGLSTNDLLKANLSAACQTTP